LDLALIFGSLIVSQSGAIMKQWYSAFELAGLSGLPALPNNVTRKAKAEQWQTRERVGRGGGKEYAYNSLPPQTQAELIQSEAKTIASPLLPERNPDPITNPTALARSTQIPTYKQRLKLVWSLVASIGGQARFMTSCSSNLGEILKIVRSDKYASGSENSALIDRRSGRCI
jgi:Mu DNA-binding domain